jgi:hypothetical protein
LISIAGLRAAAPGAIETARRGRGQHFSFAAADTSGKEQSGVLEADSARVARQLLRGRGLIR